MAPPKGSIPPNRLDRRGKRYGKLIALKDEGNGRWLCRCDCGNEVSVLSVNMAAMEKGHRGCRHCANRKDITGERVGLLVAVEMEQGPIKGHHPMWLFRCDCGGMITGTVREFHAGWLRSCGCHDNAQSSWACMMGRCYNEKDLRYRHYGGRGIVVCARWHDFANFIADMGERPKRHNLSRRYCEQDYSPSNCIWEHITKNTADTCYGRPTRPGCLKGAKPRR